MNSDGLKEFEKETNGRKTRGVLSSAQSGVVVGIGACDEARYSSRTTTID